MAEQELTQQTVLLIAAGGPSGPLPLAVGDSYDAVIQCIERARASKRGLTFSQPGGQGKVYIADARTIVGCFEQLVQVIHDPRAAGIFKTASGIDLPPR
jgi:hypothetical protein